MSGRTKTYWPQKSGQPKTKRAVRVRTPASAANAAKVYASSEFSSGTGDVFVNYTKSGRIGQPVKVEKAEVGTVGISGNVRRRPLPRGRRASSSASRSHARSVSSSRSGSLSYRSESSHARRPSRRTASSSARSRASRSSASSSRSRGGFTVNGVRGYHAARPNIAAVKYAAQLMREGRRVPTRIHVSGPGGQVSEYYYDGAVGRASQLPLIQRADRAPKRESRRMSLAR